MPFSTDIAMEDEMMAAEEAANNRNEVEVQVYQQQLAVPALPHQQQQQLEPEAADYGLVKHLLAEAEMEQKQAALHVQAAQNAVTAAQEKLEIANNNHAIALAKVDQLKSQFQTEIMDENLRQPCRWNDMYNKLILWKETHGDTCVYYDAKKDDEETKRLNRWVITQRSAYKYWNNGDKKHIKDHRIDALNKIGFVWSINDQLWDNHFEELRQFHTEYGHFNPTQKQNKKLSQFVARLRTAMHHKESGLVQNELSEGRINRLNSINFTWEMRRKPRKTSGGNTVKFDIMYEHLQSFKDTYGHTKVNKMEKEWKKGTSVPEKKIYRRLPLFVAFVRKEQLKFVQNEESLLDAEKIQMLDDLGLAWKMPPDQPRKSTGGEASRKSTKRKRPMELDGTLNNPNDDLVDGGQEYQYSEVAYGGIAPPVETEV